MSTHKPHYNNANEPDTETLAKLKDRKWWAKWISIGGISTIAAMLVALPVVKSMMAYGHDLVISPDRITALQADTAAAIKTVQGEVDTIQLHEYEDKVWKAKTDEKLDEMKQLITRLLDNQERLTHYNPAPKQNNQ